ncbi:MAG: hypothetical protein P8179_19610 [Candidatus Thiodiazotropha sp.]|jgi:hypothetical protein
MAEIQPFTGSNTLCNLLDNGTSSSISDAHTPAELNAQNGTTEQLFDVQLKLSQSNPD